MLLALNTLYFGALTTTTVAMTAPFTSDPISLENLHLIAVTPTLIGAAAIVGTLTLEGCTQAGVDTGRGPPGITGLTDWVQIPGATLAVNATGTPTLVLEGKDLAFRWARLRWAFTSGAGSLRGSYSAKGV
jgi:hypothetical protein